MKVNLIKIWDVIKCIAWILLISIVCNAYMISTRDEHKGSQNKNWPAAVIILKRKKETCAKATCNTFKYC